MREILLFIHYVSTVWALIFVLVPLFKVRHTLTFKDVTSPMLMCNLILLVIFPEFITCLCLVSFMVDSQGTIDTLKELFK